jgi:hypothetical protein
MTMAKSAKRKQIGMVVIGQRPPKGFKPKPKPPPKGYVPAEAQPRGLRRLEKSGKKPKPTLK